MGVKLLGLSILVTAELRRHGASADAEHHNGKREPTPVHRKQALPPNEEASEIAEPREGAFHFVSLPIVVFARHHRA
jgi:hypothetical protein